MEDFSYYLATWEMRLEMIKQLKTMVSIRRFFAFVVYFAGTFFLITNCDISEYQYYIRTNQLKPLIITIVDQSGSMSAYQSSITNLVESSLDVLVTELYDGDTEAMEEHTFVVGWPGGETWPVALCTAPSELMPTPGNLLFANEAVNSLEDEAYKDLLAELDEYPVRIYLFYGNGVSPSYDAAELESFKTTDYESLLISKGVVIAVPGSTEEFIYGATRIISDSGGMQMNEYGWQLQEYDPAQVTMESFAADIVGIVTE